MPRFLAIGECMVELSDAGSGLLRKGFAGDTFNTAWYARKLLPAGWGVTYLSAVGDDAVSGEMLAFMQAGGVSTDAVRIVAGAMPGLYMIAVKNGERSFSYWRDTSAARRLADDPDHLAQHLAAADIIHFSGITLGILTPDAGRMLVASLEAARKRGAMISFDTNFRSKIWQGRKDVQAMFLDAARTATVVLPGLDDELAVFGPCTAREVASRYRQAGARIIAVKDGGKGSHVFWPDGEAHVPAATPNAVVDTSAAGDSFAAGFLTRLASGADPVSAARFGAAVAAEVVAGPGALVPLSAALAAQR